MLAFYCSETRIHKHTHTCSWFAVSAISLVLSLAHGQLEGPCVLQVQKVRNISAPKDHEESQGAPRMLRLQMTDGHTTCVGLEFKHLSKIRYPFNSSIAFRNMLGLADIIAGNLMASSVNL